MGPTASTQDYLKIIFDLTRHDDLASTTAIANRLGVAPASVTGMLQRLATQDPPLVEYFKRQGVRLTREGQRMALQVIRNHRLLETYLVEQLGYSWDEVHEEACRLEHVISPKLAERIAIALGDPEIDPHGAPIPSADLTVQHTADIPCAQLQAGQQARILRVLDADPALLRYLASHGLQPSSRIAVLNRNPFDHNLTLQAEGHAPVTLGPQITQQIFVEVLA